MRRLVPALALVLIASSAAPARAQLFSLVHLDHLNSKLSGRVVDHTRNHGADRRIQSPILGSPRDLYVYLPPNYSPAIAYPLIVFLHGADVDEHFFLDPKDLKSLDQMIVRGELPPVVIAAPDGTYEGINHLNATQSLWVNGLGGRFEDHIVGEVVPFMMQNYSLRPEPQAHALIGISAGGFGAMAIAMKHRHLFGAVATLASPLNLRYDTCDQGYKGEFNPATYRERTTYDPELIIAKFYFGLVRRRVKKYLGPVYGGDPGMLEKISRDNPVDLLDTTGLRPGELALYVNYPARDNYNFDDQDKSFAWFAAQRGIQVDISKLPHSRHNLRYLERAQPPAYLWIGQHILPPVAR